VSVATPPKRILFFLLLIVLLPALFYSGYEINSLSGSEELIGQIYRQQLGTILSSVNQYSWDIAGAWASTITSLIREEGKGAPELSGALARFLGKYASVRALVFADSSFREVLVVRSPLDSTDGNKLQPVLAGALRANREKITRLIRYQLADYRKLEPIILSDSASSRVLLVFAMGGTGDQVGGFLLDESAFIRDLLAPKLREAAGTEFIVGVFRGENAEPLFVSEPVEGNSLVQRKILWLFPSSTVGIKLKGMTVEEILRRRSLRNFLLIGLLDVVLLAGVILVYRSMRRELELARMKSDFVSNVSHELRTPLALIRMFAETLDMGRIREEGKKQEYYRTILRETERLTRLVNNILNFSRMEAGKKEYHFAGVDLNGVVSGVLDTYHQHLQSAGFTPRIELGSGLPLIRGDAEAIAEALINLLDNAVKYSNEEKFLRVATLANDRTASVEVQDHGIGIAPEHREKVFEMFYRVSGGPVHTTKGSGLGLTLVKHIMEAHGGRAELESMPGKGSTFRLFFPLFHPDGEK
jgi:two-component system, OmpR family, phosphate regulon sensor histidine kinase PhoR